MGMCWRFRQDILHSSLRQLAGPLILLLDDRYPKTDSNVMPISAIHDDPFFPLHVAWTVHVQQESQTVYILRMSEQGIAAETLEKKVLDGNTY